VARSGTDPISLHNTHLVVLLLLVIVLAGETSSKSKAQSILIGSGWNLARLFFK